MLVYEQEIAQVPNKESFFYRSITMNLLRIGFNPQIYKEVETANTEFACVTEVNSAVILV